MSTQRTAEFKRNSKETKIRCVVNVDGTGKSKISTKIDFLDHMLDLFTFHGFFDIDLEVEEGDIEIDIHHTNEDVGIVLGKAFKKALGERLAEFVAEFQTKRAKITDEEVMRVIALGAVSAKLSAERTMQEALHAMKFN